MSWSLGRALQGLHRPPPQCGQLRRRPRLRRTRRRSQPRRSTLSVRRCSMQLPAPHPAQRRRPPRSRLMAYLRPTRSARLQRLPQLRQSQRELRMRSRPPSQWHPAVLERRELLRMEVCLSRSVAGRRVAAGGVSRRVGLRWPRGTGRARLPAGSALAALHGAQGAQAGAAMTGRGCWERQEGQALGRRAVRLMRRPPRRTLGVRNACANRVLIDGPLGVSHQLT